MKDAHEKFTRWITGATVDMTEGNYKAHIVRFALPLLISNLFQQLYNAADSLIVGNIVGKTALAAVSSAGNLIFLIISFFIGTAMGAGVLISRYFGAKDTENMRRAIHTDVCLGLIASAAVTLLGVLVAPLALRLMHTAPTVLPEATLYFEIFFAGAVADIMYNIFMGILNAVGNSLRPLIYLVISSCLNVALDLLFVGVFGWGVAGAAVATVLSKAASATLCFVFLLKKDNDYHIEWKELKIDKDMVSGILKYGIPSGVQNSVIGFANVIVQSHINEFGEDAMAGCGAYSKLEGFAFMPINAFTMAISTFISQNLGAGKEDRAKKGSRFGIVVSVLLAEGIGVISYIFAEPLISLFEKTPEVVYYGVLDIRTVTLFYCLLAFSHCVAAVCRGSGKAYVAMLVMLLVWCVFRVIYIRVITFFFPDNIQNIFWAYPLTWSISTVIYFIYYISGRWLKATKKEVRNA